MPVIFFSRMDSQICVKDATNSMNCVTLQRIPELTFVL